MPYALYVCLHDEDTIAAFTMEAATGQLTPQAAVPVVRVPSVLALSPDRPVLWVGHRVQPALSSFWIDATGGLTRQGTVASPHAPTFLASDRTGRYMLSASYQGGYAAVYPLGADRRGDGPAGGIPHPGRNGGADALDDVCRGPTAHGGAGHTAGRLGRWGATWTVAEWTPRLVRVPAMRGASRRGTCGGLPSSRVWHRGGGAARGALSTHGKGPGEHQRGPIFQRLDHLQRGWGDAGPPRDQHPKATSGPHGPQMM